MPQEILGPKRDFETRKKIKKAVKSWRDDGVLKDVSITDSKCWLCCETPRDWPFLCSSTLPPISQFFAACLLFLEFVIFTFCPITLIPPSPSFYIYMNSIHIALVQCPPPCLSLSEYFILFFYWVGWFSLSSNSLKKGSWVLYSLCFFFFF